MMLSCTIETFTPSDWETVFGAFVHANKSHWRGAPYDAVMSVLRHGGQFSFAVKAMDTWTCKLTLTVLPDGRLDASLVPNDGLSAIMRKHLTAMQATFEKEILVLQ